MSDLSSGGIAAIVGAYVFALCGCIGTVMWVGRITPGAMSKALQTAEDKASGNLGGSLGMIPGMPDPKALLADKGNALLGNALDGKELISGVLGDGDILSNVPMAQAKLLDQLDHVNSDPKNNVIPEANLVSNSILPTAPPIGPGQRQPQQQPQQQQQQQHSNIKKLSSTLGNLTSKYLPGVAARVDNVAGQINNAAGNFNNAVGQINNAAGIANNEADNFNKARTDATNFTTEFGNVARQQSLLGKMSGFNDVINKGVKTYDRHANTLGGVAGLGVGVLPNALTSQRYNNTPLAKHNIVRGNYSDDNNNYGIPGGALFGFTPHKTRGGGKTKHNRKTNKESKVKRPRKPRTKKCLVTKGNQMYMSFCV